MFNSTTNRYTVTTGTLKPFAIGFDNFFRTFDMFESLNEDVNVKFPPHDIIKVEDNKFRIDMALAGYSKDQISIELDSNVLTIKSKKKEKDIASNAIHKGISNKSFSKTFTLADDITIESATMENGMLSINLVKLTKPTTKTIEIQ